MNKSGPDDSKAQYEPTVSIGMPVYNGEATLKEALDSLLAQTFQDFELIICDNASTDDTSEIAKKYAARDRRIRYYRSDRNRGAAANYNWSFDLSRGEFFKWHAADDLVDPEYLDACLAPLKEQNDVVLCYPMRRLIAHDGTPIASDPYAIQYRYLPEDRLDNLSLVDLLRLYDSRIPLLVFGLIRRSVLAKTGLIGAFPASDVNLVYELRLHGRFAQIAKPLYIQRLHPPSPSVFARMTRKGDATWFGVKRGLAVESPEIKLFIEMLKSYRRAYIQRYGQFPINETSLIKAVVELLAFRAHFEIRTVRSLSHLAQRIRTTVFDEWSQLSESFLSPDFPTLFALRIWMALSAFVNGRPNEVISFLHSVDSDDLLVDCLSRLMERNSEQSLSLLTAWLENADPVKAGYGFRAFAKSSADNQAVLLNYLKQKGVHELYNRLESQVLNSSSQPATF